MDSSISADDRYSLGVDMDDRDALIATNVASNNLPNPGQMTAMNT